MCLRDSAITACIHAALHAALPLHVAAWGLRFSRLTIVLAQILADAVLVLSQDLDLLSIGACLVHLANVKQLKHACNKKPFTHAATGLV